MSEDVECPYCGEWQEIYHDDGQGYEEGKIHDQECDDCGKTFIFSTSISYYYDANKADCLNGGEHVWKILDGYANFGLEIKVCRVCETTESSKISTNEKGPDR